MKPEVIKLKQALIEGGIVYGNPEMSLPNNGIRPSYPCIVCLTLDCPAKDCVISEHDEAMSRWRSGRLPFEDMYLLKKQLHDQAPEAWQDDELKMQWKLKDGLYSVDLDVTVVKQTRRKDLVPCAIWQDGTTQIKLPNYEYRKVLRIN